MSRHDIRVAILADNPSLRNMIRNARTPQQMRNLVRHARTVFNREGRSANLPFLNSTAILKLQAAYITWRARQQNYPRRRTSPVRRPNMYANVRNNNIGKASIGKSNSGNYVIVLSP